MMYVGVTQEGRRKFWCDGETKKNKIRGKEMKKREKKRRSVGEEGDERKTG